MAVLISVLIVYFIGYLISVSDDNKQWMDEEYQRARLNAAIGHGYDINTVTSYRDKCHKKYGYTYDKEMKNKVYNMSKDDYYDFKKEHPELWWKDQMWVKKPCCKAVTSKIRSCGARPCDINGRKATGREVFYRCIVDNTGVKEMWLTEYEGEYTCNFPTTE